MVSGYKDGGYTICVKHEDGQLWFEDVFVKDEKMYRRVVCNDGVVRWINVDFHYTSIVEVYKESYIPFSLDEVHKSDNPKDPESTE